MLKLSKFRNALFAGACIMAIAVPAHAQLEQALGVAKSSTAASAAAQRQVEQADDDADSMVRDYRAVLQQIDNMQLFVDQQDIHLESQSDNIKSLNKQLGSVDVVKRGMVPMMLRMAARIEDSVKSDMPFQIEERMARIKTMKSVLSDPSVTPTEQYRQILSVYKNEVNYGLGMDSYEAAHPNKPGVKVDYLMVGRFALIYMTKDETDMGYYNMGTGDWETVPSSRAPDIRQAIRMAAGQSETKMVFVPMPGVK